MRRVIIGLLFLACALGASAEYDVATGAGVKLWMGLDNVAFARVAPGARFLSIHPDLLLDLPDGDDLTATVVEALDARVAASADWERHEYPGGGIIWVNYGWGGIAWAWRDRGQVVLAISERKRFSFAVGTEPGASIVADLDARVAP